MEPPVKPSNEKERLESLRALQILKTPVDKSFEQITRITKKLFDVPMVGVSIVGDKKQWFKSSIGLKIEEIERKNSFCSHAILNNDFFIIEDTHQDERFKDNPLVTNKPNIRFYAGYPIQSLSGHLIGTLCIFDNKPRTFSPEDIQYLQDLASFVDLIIQLKKGRPVQLGILESISATERLTMLDSLTQVWNRETIEKIIFKKITPNKRYNDPFGIALLDLDDFRYINNNYGRQAGDQVLKMVSAAMIDFFRDEDIIGRWHGDQFLIICKTNNIKELDSIGARLTDLIRNLIISYQDQIIGISATVALMHVSPTPESNIELFIEELYLLLQKGKQRGKNTYLVS